MPLYTFRCASGHVTERLAPINAAFWLCSCGEAAKRQSVYSHASPRKWASEFHVSREMRAAIDESVGYKHEAVAAMNEAVGNGWKEKDNG